jgi:hypothetical protein
MLTYPSSTCWVVFGCANIVDVQVVLCATRLQRTGFKAEPSQAGLTAPEPLSAGTTIQDGLQLAPCCRQLQVVMETRPVTTAIHTRCKAYTAQWAWVCQGAQTMPKPHRCSCGQKNHMTAQHAAPAECKQVQQHVQPVLGCPITDTTNSTQAACVNTLA